MRKIIIVDDLDESILSLKNYIEKYYQNKNISINLDIFKDGLDFIENYKCDADIIFMDIDMEFMNGLKASHKLREIDKDVLLIFQTKMVQYAAEGYDVDAIGFLVKPITYPNFLMKIEKAEAILNKRIDTSIVIKTKDGNIKLNTHDIIYVEVNGHNLNYVTEQNSFSTYGSLKDCLNQLEDYGFIEISRYYLVNIKYINSFKGNELKIKDKVLYIGKTKKKKVMQLLGEYFNG